MTAKRIPGQIEEKDVPYRKEQLSSSDDLEHRDNANSQDEEEEDEEEHPEKEVEDDLQSQFGDAEHQDVKHCFVNMLDAGDRADFDHLHFYWSK